MKTIAKLVILSAAASCSGVLPAGAEDVLIVSPLVGTAVGGPPEPGSFDPLPGSDAWIADQVEESFVSHRSAAASDAGVDVRAGVVRLSGVTVSESHRAEATAYARTVPGVKGVDNRMKVAGTAVAVRSTALDRMNDAGITVRVKAALLRRHPAEAFKTKVATRNGVVVLKGRVASEAEKDGISRIAGELDGIAAVDDRLIVAP